MSTDVKKFISELDAGVFEQVLSHVLSDVSAAVIDNEKKGRVSIDLNFERIGTSFQVSVSHKITHVKPTLNGRKSEETTKVTPMHVGKGGRLSFFPEDQTQLFDVQGNVRSNK